MSPLLPFRRGGIVLGVEGVCDHTHSMEEGLWLRAMYAQSTVGLPFDRLVPVRFRPPPLRLGCRAFSVYLKIVRVPRVPQFRTSSLKRPLQKAHPSSSSGPL